MGIISSSLLNKWNEDNDSIIENYRQENKRLKKALKTIMKLIKGRKIADEVRLRSIENIIIEVQNV